MSRPRGVRRFFRMRWGRDWARREVELEFEHHLDMRVEELVEEGVAPAEARRMAEDAFGDLRGYRARCMSERRREATMTRTREFVEGVASDARFALRSIWKQPGFALAMVLTLGLGIGANTAIFTVLDHMVLRDIPFPEPDELYDVFTRTEAGWTFFALDRDAAFAMAEADGPLTGLTYTARLDVVRTDGAEPATLPAEALRPGALDILGVPPALGRAFNVDDARPGADPVAIVSHRYWRGALGGDPGVVGRTLVLDDVDTRVVGVMAPEFAYPLYGTTDVYLPLDDQGSVKGIDMVRVRAFVRVPEDQRAAAESAATALVAGLLEARPDVDPWTPTFQPMNQPRAGMGLKQALYVTFGASALMLLVALVNAVNLGFVRGWSRQREIGVRLALGGSRRRVVAGMLTENVILAVAGGVVAVAMAAFGVGVLWGLAPGDLTFRALAEPRVDGRVLVFTGLLSAAVGLLVGLYPALRSVSSASATSQASLGALSGSSRAQGRRRAAFVVAQVALTLTLLFGAGLMVRSFQRLVAQDPGMDLDGLVALDVQLSRARYPDADARAAFVMDLTERLRAVPGVSAVTSGWPGLPQGGITFGDEILLEGAAEPAVSGPVEVSFANADPSLRRTLGTELRAGRDLTEADMGLDRVLVSETLARLLGATTPQQALGMRFSLDGDGPWLEVVGVVEDVRINGLDPNFGREAMLTLLDDDESFNSVGFVVRSSAPAPTVFAAVRAAVPEADPTQPIQRVATVASGVREAVDGPRFFMGLMSGFAALGLALAGIGLFGVLSFVVRQRTREMGIRVALGAESSDVRSLVLRGGLGLALLGVAVGSAVSLWAGGTLEGLLFETSPRDVATLAGTSALLLGVAALASYLPARRATQVDPVEVLKAE